MLITAWQLEKLYLHSSTQYIKVHKNSCRVVLLGFVVGLFLGFIYTKETDSIPSLFMFLIYNDKGYQDTDFAVHYEILLLLTSNFRHIHALQNIGIQSS